MHHIPDRGRQGLFYRQSRSLLAPARRPMSALRRDGWVEVMAAGSPRPFEAPAAPLFRIIAIIGLVRTSTMFGHNRHRVSHSQPAFEGVIEWPEPPLIYLPAAAQVSIVEMHQLAQFFPLAATRDKSHGNALPRCEMKVLKFLASGLVVRQTSLFPAPFLRKLQATVFPAGRIIDTIAEGPGKGGQRGSVGSTVAFNKVVRSHIEGE